VDFDRVGAHLKLSLGVGWDPLSIERIGADEVAVSHTFVQNGDVVFDPEVTFFTGYGGGAWVPTSITQPPVSTTARDGVFRRFGANRPNQSGIIIVEHTQSQQIELSPTVHLAFDEFQPVDVTFDLSIAPGLNHRRSDRQEILPNASGKSAQCGHWAVSCLL
jgi:hypothetical protein